MEETLYGFDEESVRRIVASVLDSEKRRKNTSPESERERRRTQPEFIELEGTVHEYDTDTKVVTLTGVPVTLPTGARNTHSVKYLFNKFNIDIEPNDKLHAIYERGVYEDEEYGRVDWTVRPYTGSEGVKTWNCQLYNNSKAFANASALVKLLKHDMTPFGEDGFPAYDPHNQFSSGGSETAFGVVEMVLDAETGTSRLEFRELAGPAWLLCVTLNDVGTGTGLEPNAVVNGYWGIGWWKNNPGAEVFVDVCGTNLPPNGTKTLAFLADPDTSPLSYRVADAPPLPTNGANVKYAIVTKAMTQAVHTGEGNSYTIDPDSTVGECILLEYNWTGSEWQLVASPFDGTGTELSGVVEFINGYEHVPIKVGKVIQLTSDEPIIPGLVAAEDKKIPVGRYFDIIDYLEALDSHIPGTNQILWHPANGLPEWAGKLCGTGT